MEQIMGFLTENGSMLFAAGLLLAYLLQAAALHRLKKVERQLDQTGKNLIHSMDMLLKEREELQKLLAMAEKEQKKTEEEAVPAEKREAQEELIDEVLSEVFL